MGTAIAIRTPADLEALLIQGDLAKLSADQRVTYYKAVCESVGLNPLTQPFEYIVLSGRLRLYARKDCTDQLRKIHRVSVVSMDHEMMGDVYLVTCKVLDGGNRTDVATGAVCVKGLQGEAMANALMKGETKAKRRATLSICGLGMLDETEVDDTSNARPAPPPAPEYTAPPKAPAPASTTAAAAVTATAAATTTPKATTPPVPTPGEMWRKPNTPPPPAQAETWELTDKGRADLAASKPPVITVEDPPMIDNPARVAQVALIRRMMIDQPPTGLAWHPKHAEGWLRKYFGVDKPIKMALGQARDAEHLLRARAKPAPAGPEEYARLLEMFFAEQRVLTAEVDA